MKTNSSIFYLLFLFSLLGSTPVLTQSITEHFGGHKVNFEIRTAEEVVLNNTFQYLVSRGSRTSERTSWGDEGYGYGYGLQSIHLEFESKQEVTSNFETHKSRYSYRMYFYDENQEEIAVIELPKDSLKMATDAHLTKQIYYSVDLRDIPLLLFDVAATIDIVKVGK